MATNPTVVVSTRLGLDQTSIRKTEAEISRRLGGPFRIKLDTRTVGRPLGKITGDVQEFGKSLAASNARVIAFGASAGLIFGVQRAFTALLRSTIQVEKSLKDINVILNTDSKGLRKFGSDLFKIANDTAQSFDTVATAATEFSRQGLGMQDTLKRTRDALILTRLSGLDAGSSVQALTAALNSFNKTALDSTSVVNRLANVDAAFAVSSKDLAESIRRVGSSAQDAGVSFNSLIALVTAAQERTARGGQVLGNSFKTIFQRIGRPQVLSQLDELGIATRDFNREMLSADKILINVAQKFDRLSEAERNQVVQLSAGIFQANVFRAILGDLARGELSAYNRALDTANRTTNEAIIRNQELNETFSALLTRAQNVGGQLGANIGDVAFAPSFQKLLSGVVGGAQGLNKELEEEGANMAKILLRGFGEFVGSSGLLLVGGVIIKLSAKLIGFIAKSAKGLSQLNPQFERMRQTQEAFNKVLENNNIILQKVLNRTISKKQAEEAVLNILRLETAQLKQQEGLVKSMAASAASKGIFVNQNGLLVPRKGAPKGHVPGNAQTPLQRAINREREAGIPTSKIRVGADPRLVSSSNPGGIGVFNTIDEPRGLGQGVQREINAGRDPKKAGLFPSFQEDTRRLRRDLSTNPYPVKPLASLADAFKEAKEAAKSLGKTHKEQAKISSKATKIEEKKLAPPPFGGKIPTSAQLTPLEQSIKQREFIKEARRQFAAAPPGLPQHVIGNQMLSQQVKQQKSAALLAAASRRSAGVPRIPIPQNLTPSQLSAQQAQQQRRAALLAAASRGTGAPRTPIPPNLTGNQLLGPSPSVFIRATKRRLAQERLDERTSRRNRAIYNRALGVGFLAPLVLGGAKEAIGEETLGQRRTGAGVGALSDILSFGATGAILGQGPGLATGLAAGAFKGFATIFKEWNNTLPEATRRLDDIKNKTQIQADTFASLLSILDKASNISPNDKENIRLLTEQFQQTASEAIKSGVDISTLGAGVLSGGLVMGQENAARSIVEQNRLEFAAELTKELASGRGLDLTRTKSEPPTFIGGFPVSSGKINRSLTKTGEEFSSRIAQVFLENYRDTIQSGSFEDLLKGGVGKERAFRLILKPEHKKGLETYSTTFQDSIISNIFDGLKKQTISNKVVQSVVGKGITPETISTALRREFSVLQNISSGQLNIGARGQIGIAELKKQQSIGSARRSNALGLAELSQGTLRIADLKEQGGIAAAKESRGIQDAILRVSLVDSITSSFGGAFSKLLKDAGQTGKPGSLSFVSGQFGGLEGLVSSLQEGNVSPLESLRETLTTNIKDLLGLQSDGGGLGGEEGARLELFQTQLNAINKALSEYNTGLKISEKSFEELSEIVELNAKAMKEELARRKIFSERRFNESLAIQAGQARGQAAFYGANQNRFSGAEIAQAQAQANTLTRQELGVKGRGREELRGAMSGFGEELLFNGPSMFSQIENDSRELSRTMRSEFQSAFKSFVDGTNSAGNAFRSFGLGVANKMLDISTSFSTNLLFNSLFNSSGLTNFFSGGQFNQNMQRRATGGIISGGSGMKDDVPILAQGGEYVLNKRTVKRIGKQNLDSINAGGLTRDPTLSAFALNDPSNPQNSLRTRLEQDYFNYLRSREATKAARKQFERASKQRFFGGLLSAGVGVAGAGISSYRSNTSGLMSTGYSNASYSGGSSNLLRTGYQSGGAIPNVIRNTGGSDVSQMLSELINVTSSVREAILEKNGMKSQMAVDKTVNTNQKSQNVFNVTVNMSSNGDVNTKSNTQPGPGVEDQEASIEKARSFERSIKNMFTKFAIEQQEPGGILSSVSR